MQLETDYTSSKPTIWGKSKNFAWISIQGLKYDGCKLWKVHNKLCKQCEANVGSIGNLCQIKQNPLLFVQLKGRASNQLRCSIAAHCTLTNNFGCLVRSYCEESALES